MTAVSSMRAYQVQMRRISAVFRSKVAHGNLLALLIVAVAGVTGYIQPRFFNSQNIWNIVREWSYLAIVAPGQMLVMIAAGFDLSVGVVAAMASIITASLMAAHFLGVDVNFLTMTAPLVIAVGAGAFVGLANGLGVACLDLSPFMTTLATTSIVEGAILYFDQGIPIYGIPDQFIATIGRGSVAYVPVSVLVALVVFTVVLTVQRLTPLGRHIYAMGSNPQAAKLAGVPAVRTLLIIYSTSGILAACMGVLLTARIGSGQANLGSLIVIKSISAAVIGGVSLRGGSGRVERVILAALFLTVVGNSMNLLQVNSKLQPFVMGVVVILAVGLERMLSRTRVTL